MDTIQMLKQAIARMGPSAPFAVRDAFGKRVGRQIVVPSGYGSALTRAVHLGYLRVVTQGTRRRGSIYEFTPEGRALIEQEGRA